MSTFGEACSIFMSTPDWLTTALYIFLGIFVFGIALYFIVSPFALIAGLINPGSRTRLGVLVRFGIPTTILSLFVWAGTSSNLPAQESIASITYGSSAVESPQSIAETPNIAKVASSNPAYGMHETVTVGNWKLKANYVSNEGSELSYFGNSTKASGEWLVISISLENTGDEVSSLPLYNFKVKDSKGRTYKNDSFKSQMYGNDQEGNSIPSEVVPGGQVDCYLVFDISPGAESLQLDFNPNLFAKNIQIDLS